MRLKANKPRDKYKSESTYIRAVFNANKKKIIENISNEWVKNIDKDEFEFLRNNYTRLKKSKKTDFKYNEKQQLEKEVYRAFKDLVESQMAYTNPKTNKNYTAVEAIAREARSKDLNKYWDTKDVYARNFHSLVKKYDDVKKEFYQHEGIKKIDYRKYNFEGYYQLRGGGSVAVYSYGDSYFLQAQSPKGKAGVGSLTYLTKQEFDEYIRIGRIAFEVSRRRK